MDVTPMSMQMVVPRVSDAQQVQQNLNQAGALQQDFEALREKADARLKQQQVRDKAKAEDGRIKDDPDRQKRQGASAGGRQAPEDEESASESQEEMNYAVDPARGHHLDISL